jgi:RNA polymerase sigma factor (sigma-70 family)
MNDELRNILWIKFKDGDNNALSKLYMEFAHELYSYGLKIAKDENLAKDCIQEVFIQLIEKRKSLLITSRIHIYLFKSLRNKILEELRTKNRKQDINTQLSENGNEQEVHPEQLMIDSEEKESIRNKIGLFIAKLPIRQKEIICLKYTEGFNYDEIAELLNIDKASARTLLYRSLKTIKEQLSNNVPC